MSDGIPVANLVGVGALYGPPTPSFFVVNGILLRVPEPKRR